MAERRLAAILMADIVGYTRLMNVDERGTHQRVQRLLQELVQPTITEHRGRLVKTQGDGYLAMFDSPVEAVRCAIVIQQSMIGRNLEMELPRDRWIQFRIGVNVGDVIVEPDDIYGDGVNVAQRLEALADPGTIYISGAVYEQIRYKLVCGYQSLGDKRVKNILDPVPTYKVLPDPASVAKAAWRGRARVATVAGGTLAVLLVAGVTWWYLTDRPKQVAAAKQPQPVISAPTPPPPPVVAPAAPTPSPQPAAPQPTAVTPPAPAPAPPQPAPVNPPAPTPAPPQPVVVAPTPPAQPVVVAPTPAPSPSSPLVVTPPEILATKPPPKETTDDPPHEQQRVAMVAPPVKPTEPRVDEPQMVVVSGGIFRMGSTEDSSEQPIRSVIIKPFMMAKSLITVRQWRDCVLAKACKYEPKASDPDDAPVNNVSWDDTQQYIGWLSKATQKEYRLPSEAEWEYAARGGTETKYWWGNNMKPGYANCIGCGGETGQPTKIGLNPANPYGLFIADGSLAEWVADCWVKDYHGAPVDHMPRTIPDCRARVLRSGSWRNDASYVRSSSRDWYDASVRYPTHGFRVARSLY